MSVNQISALLPELSLAGAAVIILIVIAVRRSYFLSFLVSLAGCAASIAWALVPQQAPIGLLLSMDSYARFFVIVVVATNACVLLLSYAYFRRYRENREEFFVLLLLETLGATVLVASTHFVTFFLGLELLSVSLYGLLAYVRTRRISIEAGLKYFVPAAVSSAFLLFGMALLYRETGSMEFAKVAQTISGVTAAGAQVARAGSAADAFLSASGLLLIAGLVMVIVAIGFKLALVPFHMWAADVYQGTSAPVSASIGSVSKIAMFALFFRLFAGIDLSAHPAVRWLLIVIAVLSMLGGSWLALRQSNVKRLLAYSSTAHLGYMMLPLIAGGAVGVSASAFYLVAYSATTVGLFGVVTLFSGVEGESDREEHYRGLAWRRPGVAFIFTIMLLSIAGIPLTAGFMGKLYLIGAGVGASQWVLAGALIISSGIGLFYYLRLLGGQFSRVDPATDDSRGAASVVPAFGPPRMPVPAAIALVLATCVVLFLGFYPTPLVSVIATLVPGG